MKNKFWQRLRATWLPVLLTAGLTVPASGGEPPVANTVAPDFQEVVSAERLRQRLQEAIDDFKDAANAALDEVTQPGSDDDLCAKIAAQWGQSSLKGLVPANDNSESMDDSTESGDTLVVALSILKGPWSPPGLDDGQDLFVVYRIDPKGRWIPSAVCIRAGPRVLTMKPERTQYGAFPNL